MHELGRAQKWIYGKLTGAAAVTAAVGNRVYAEQAPEKTLLPYVIFSHTGGFDTRGVGTVRIQTNPVFQIKIVCAGAPTDAVRSALDALDDLFQTAVAEPSETLVFSSRREQLVYYVESVPGSADQYTHTGGLYRLVIYPEA